MANLNGTGSGDIEGAPPPAVVNNTSVFKLFKEKLLVPVYGYLKETVCHFAKVVVIPIGRIWNNIGRVLFWEEVVLGMPPSSTPTFIVTALLAFVEIKSQGQGKADYPFQTHPHATMVCITSVVVYGFASLAEVVVAAAGFDRASVYAIVARLGRVASLSVLVATLASLLVY